MVKTIEERQRAAANAMILDMAGSDSGYLAVAHRCIEEGLGVEEARAKMLEKLNERKVVREAAQEKSLLNALCGL